MKSEIGLRRATMLFITNDNFGLGQWLYIMKLLVIMQIIFSVLVD